MDLLKCFHLTYTVIIDTNQCLSLVAGCRHCFTHAFSLTRSLSLQNYSRYIFVLNIVSFELNCFKMNLIAILTFLNVGRLEVLVESFAFVDRCLAEVSWLVWFSPPIALTLILHF